MAVTCLVAGCASLKMTIPDAFTQQATKQHVKGAKRNRMSLDQFTISRVKRGITIIYPPGWGRAYYLENLFLNQLGISMDGVVENQKGKFHYSIADANNRLEVYAHEMSIKEETQYTLFTSNSIFNNFSELQNYYYIFTAVIGGDSTKVGKDWQMILTNVYDRKASGDHNPFTFINTGDNGMATNGTDTIFIKPIDVKQRITKDGQTKDLPFKLLAGYELSTSGGVIAVMDLIKKDVWFYNELDASERLVVGAISTAIFARRVHDQGW
ncbi:hypothetical protein [Chitinophaga sp.]|uniref:hypothetical protein n=1 Tax=Chitinophaga sp. TaxID=1869181 RepID=UPI0031D17595